MFDGKLPEILSKFKTQRSQIKLKNTLARPELIKVPDEPDRLYKVKIDAVAPKITNDFKIFNERHSDRFKVDLKDLRKRPKDYLYSNLGGLVSKRVPERMMESLAK